MRCCICTEIIADPYGHNAEPIAGGRCCGFCNDTAVIPTRMRMAVLARHKLQTKAIFKAKIAELKKTMEDKYSKLEENR